MQTVLVSSSEDPNAPDLAADLQAAGFEVRSIPQCTNILQSVIKQAADYLVLFERSADPAFFAGISAINDTAPLPVVMFTTDPDAGRIGQAIEAGVHAYIVNGYASARLRSVMHLAQARFRHERGIRDELAGVNQRFAERKLVDRAKGIIMGARQLREEEAYRALRSAAMHSKQRIGQVALQVIETAHYAEAVNRAGQLRMLSQRTAKSYALACASPVPADAAAAIADCTDKIQANIATLSRNLSKETFGDLLEAVLVVWQRLRTLIEAPVVLSRLTDVDRAADEMLLRAEQLTANLEVAGARPALRVINVAGRQRMLSQRLAKEALVASLAPRRAGKRAGPDDDAQQAFTDGLTYLRDLPLSNPAINRELDAAGQSWDRFCRAMAQARTDAGRQALADESEALLAHFEQVTDQLERALQSLL